MDKYFISHGLMFLLQQEGFCTTGTLRDNGMAKYCIMTR